MHVCKHDRIPKSPSFFCLVSMVFFAVFTSLVPLTAQTAALIPAGSEPSWLSFARGKRLYASKEFGNALLAFDSAIEFRRVAFAYAEDRLTFVLDTRTAKKSDGTLSGLLNAFALEDFLANDYQKMVKSAQGLLRPLIKLLKAERISEAHRAFLDVLELVLQYRSFESLSDSPGALMIQVDELSLYPEAEYWKGRVFLIEGELAITIRQYLRAFDMRGSLEIPEDRYMILYSLADIYATGKDYLAWENTMKRILRADPIAGDPNYTSPSGMSFDVDFSDPKIDVYLRDAMMTTLSGAGVDKFMTLYRVQPSFSLRANTEIAAYYLERGRARAPLHAAIAVNMILTRAMAIYASRERDYVWNGLADFLSRAKTREDVSAYIEDTQLFSLLLTLADSLYLGNSRQSALEIWKIASAGTPVPWSASARERLANPAGAVKRNVSGLE